MQVVRTAVLVAIMGAASVGAEEAQEGYEEFEEQMEKTLRDGERWACAGDAILFLVGDFRGTTKNTRGLGLYFVNFDMDSPRPMQTFIDGLSERVWIFEEAGSTTKRIEAQMFSIEATALELASNTPAKGRYVRGEVSYSENNSREFDLHEHSEFKCQRFNGWKTIKKDGRYESIYPTWNGDDLDILKISPDSR